MAKTRRYSRRALLPGSRTSRPILSALGRGFALFLGAFSLLNLAGELRFAGFDANYWWIDFRPVAPAVSRLLLAVASALLLAYSIWPVMSPRRRAVTAALAGVLLFVTLWNTLRFYVLLWRRAIEAGFPLAFSLLAAVALGTVFAAVLGHVPGRRTNRPASAPIVMAAVVAACVVGFPIAQMYCFGKTDYRRQADAIVVFGARVYADGHASDALADRVRTACRLYLDGLAHRVILSGGPGDGAIHETQAMREMAVELGVPSPAIVLDTQGINTQATVTNTCTLLRELGASRVLVVSHFYHLPRIKMSYQRASREVYTVPAQESYTLTKLPVFIIRELAALWLYYLRPLLPSGF